MTDPDEFPLKGTWSVNQLISTGELFITESKGDGTGSTIEIGQHCGKMGIPRFDPGLQALLNQICLRHNEGIREEANTYAEIRKAMHRDDAAEERANLKTEEEEG